MPLEIRLLCTCSALMQSKKATPRDPLAKLSLPDRFMALFYLLQPLTYPLRKLGCIVLCRRSWMDSTSFTTALDKALRNLF